MAQDHATRKSAGGNGSSRGPIPGFVWFVAGLAVGGFGSFLYRVATEVPADPEVEALVERSSDTAPDETPMKWEFYDIFPRSEVPIVEEYAPDGSRTQIQQDSAFLLQAGSFRNPEDADALRAELILQGMNVFIRQVDNDGVAWHRVMVGPLDTEIELNRQRRALAEANIPSIVLRIPKG